MASKKDIIVYCPTCKGAIVYTIPKTLPQTPRAYCNSCKKQFGVATAITASRSKSIKPKKKSNIPPINVTSGRKVVGMTSSSLTSVLPKYPDVNIKALIKNTAVDIIYKRDFRNLGKALDILTKPEFIQQGEIKHGIYWTSETPPYERPFWLFPWQGPAIDMFRNGNMLYRASRQSPGKTLSATFADFEDMLYNPGTVITIVAPTVPLAKRLLHQMFHETIQVKRCEPLPGGGWEQIPTELKINLWNEIFEPYFLTKNQGGDKKLEKVMKNGSRIQVLTLDTAAVQGLSSDVIHIEEFDKIVQLTKQGDISDKLEAVAALLPQLRARPNSKIRITCNMASGLFDLLYDALFDFGNYFLIYEELENPNQIFNGLHTIANEDVIYMDKNDLPTTPTIDDMLKKLLTVLVSSSFAAQQISNIKMHSEEVFNPKKLKIAYRKGKELVPRLVYPLTGMAADPGAGHAYAFGIAGTLGFGHTRKIEHLWSENYYAADDWDKLRFNSKLEEIGYTTAYKYVENNCTFFATESNSGAKLITPYIESFVKQLLTGYEYINKEWKFTGKWNLGGSSSRWKVIWTNFGAEKPEGKETPSVTPKNIFINVLSLVFEYEMIALRDKTEAEQKLHRELILYDPSKRQDKFKGDQADMLLHLVYHIVGGNERKFLKEIGGKPSVVHVETW